MRVKQTIYGRIQKRYETAIRRTLRNVQCISSKIVDFVGFFGRFCLVFCDLDHQFFLPAKHQNKTITKSAIFIGCSFALTDQDVGLESDEATRNQHSHSSLQNKIINSFQTYFKIGTICSFISYFFWKPPFE